MTFDVLGPGLHLLREAEPLKRAGVLAVNLRAELCATLPQADAALAQRLALPRLDASALADLESVARRVARSHRIAAGTREQAEVDVGHRLAHAGVGVAVHPTTIRDRAAAVESARGHLAEAERDVLEVDAELASAEEAHAAQMAASHVSASADVAASERMAAERTVAALRTRRSRSIGALVSSFGIVLILSALGIPLWVALLPTLITSLWATVYLKPRSDRMDDDGGGDRGEASALLQLVEMSTAEAFEGRGPFVRLDQRKTLAELARAAALEELRVAERAWRELAGDDVDISELEQVVRRYDPQHEDARLLAAETVGVRTTDLVLRLVVERWEAMWRDIGIEPPPPERAEEEVRAFAARVRRAIVLVGPAITRGEDLSHAAPGAAVVVIDGPTEVDGSAQVS